MSQTAYVEADLNYLVNTGERPVNYAITPPEGQQRRTGTVDPRRVRVENARLAPVAPTLDRNGFQLVRHATELSDFADDEAIRSVYYAEVQALIERVTGASKVVIFDHTQRLGRIGHTEAKLREPATRVHNDQTFVSGPRRVRDHLPAEEAELRLTKRHAIINVWRPVTPVETWPLAMCDARSIDPSDLIAQDLVYTDKVGETYGFQANAAHRWSYFPVQQPDEVLLLKIFDSNTDGTARLTAHTSFQDPTSAADAAPRRSIEVRTLVFWD